MNINIFKFYDEFWNFFNYKTNNLKIIILYNKDLINIKPQTFEKSALLK